MRPLVSTVKFTRLKRSLLKRKLKNLIHLKKKIPKKSQRKKVSKKRNKRKAPMMKTLTTLSWKDFTERTTIRTSLFP